MFVIDIFILILSKLRLLKVQTNELILLCFLSRAVWIICGEDYWFLGFSLITFCLSLLLSRHAVKKLIKVKSKHDGIDRLRAATDIQVNIITPNNPE